MLSLGERNRFSRLRALVLVLWNSSLGSIFLHLAVAKFSLLVNYSDFFSCKDISQPREAFADSMSTTCFLRGKWSPCYLQSPEQTCFPARSWPTLTLEKEVSSLDSSSLYQTGMCSFRLHSGISPICSLACKTDNPQKMLLVLKFFCS